MNPGITIVFEASICSASAALRFGPTWAILEPSISTSAWLKLPTFGSRLRTQPPFSNVRWDAIFASSSIELKANVPSSRQHPASVDSEVDASDGAVFEQERRGV